MRFLIHHGQQRIKFQIHKRTHHHPLSNEESDCGHSAQTSNGPYFHVIEYVKERRQRGPCLSGFAVAAQISEIAYPLLSSKSGAAVLLRK